jgi:hypothetical protein
MTTNHLYINEWDDDIDDDDFENDGGRRFENRRPSSAGSLRGSYAPDDIEDPDTMGLEDGPILYQADDCPEDIDWAAGAEEVRARHAYRPIIDAWVRAAAQAQVQVNPKWSWVAEASYSVDELYHIMALYEEYDEKNWHSGEITKECRCRRRILFDVDLGDVEPRLVVNTGPDFRRVVVPFEYEQVLAAVAAVQIRDTE